MMPVRSAFIFLIFLILPAVHSFGIASPYVENNTLILDPGESKDYRIEVQNSDERVLLAKVFVESSIAQIVDEQETYSVGNRTPVREITLRITAPLDARPGDEFVVKYGAFPVSGGENSISLSIKINKELKVRISGDPFINSTTIPEIEEPANPDSYIIIALGLTSVILLVFLMLYKKSSMLTKRYRR